MEGRALTAGQTNEEANATGGTNARARLQLAVLATGNPSLWMKLISVFYGMGPSDERVSTTIVRNDLHRFARAATIVTALLSTVGMAGWYMLEPPARPKLVVAAAVYAAVLVLASVFFVLRQRALDRRHGRTKAEFELVDLEPAVEAEFKRAISSGALASWAWVLVGSYATGHYPALLTSGVVMWAFTTYRRSRSIRVRTVPAQMRFQAVNFTVHVLLSSAIYAASQASDRPIEIAVRTPWLPCLSVLALGLVSAGTTWRAASKIEAHQRRSAHPSVQDA